MTEAKVVIASFNGIMARDYRRLPFAQNIGKMLDWGQIAAPLSLSVSDFSSEALSGKSALNFPLRISATIDQHAEFTRFSIPAVGTFRKTAMNDPHPSDRPP